MQPKPSETKPVQLGLFRRKLELIVDKDHPLVQLASKMDWESFNLTMGATYCEHTGRQTLRA